jgi:hypothetical protein
VPMKVPVPYARFNRFIMGMLVMRIMLVLVFVLHCFMTMLVNVSLR